jgi:hypothetical protein
MKIIPWNVIEFNLLKENELNLFTRDIILLSPLIIRVHILQMYNLLNKKESDEEYQ